MHEVRLQFFHLLLWVFWIFVCFSVRKSTFYRWADKDQAYKTKNSPCSLGEGKDELLLQICEWIFCSNLESNYIMNDSYCCPVLVGVAVVRSWEYSQSDLFLSTGLLITVPINLHLMPSNNHFNFIVLKEPFSLYFTVVIRTSSYPIRLPLNNCFIRRVTPHQITYDSLVLDINDSIDLL